MGRSPLSELRVAKPCHASWSEMVGNEQVRHCSQCKKNVFNISNMTQAEAVELIRQTEGHLCVRFYRRKDGAILTRDCSFGERVSVKSRLALAAVAAVVGITLTAGCTYTTGDAAEPDEAPKASSETKATAEHAPATEASAQTPTQN